MKTLPLQELFESDLFIGSNPLEQILLETYTLIGENINPDNRYEYTADGKTIWSFIDEEGFRHMMKFNYNPGLKDKELTVKFFWYDNGNKTFQKPPVTDEKVFNTHLYIFLHEILPMLPKVLSHFSVDKLTLDAVDQARYRLYRLALSRLLDKNKYSLVLNPEVNTLYIKLK